MFSLFYQADMTFVSAQSFSIWSTVASCVWSHYTSSHVVLCIRVKVPLPGVTWECVFCSLSVWSHRLGFSLPDSCQHPCHCYSNCAGWCRRTGSGNNEITTLWQTSRSHFFSVSLQEIFPDGSLLCGGEQLPPSGGQREHTGHPHTR